MSALHLNEVRARAAAALAPASEDDPDVLFDYPDAAQPPSLILIWDDPWLTPETFGPCLFKARFAVLCVVGRVNPAIEQLEGLVGYTIARLQADGYSWPQAQTQAPRNFEIGGIPLLGARVVYQVDVTTNGGA